MPCAIATLRMAASEGATLTQESLTWLHWIGILLAAITGAIHLWLGVGFITDPLGWSFLFAGIVFFLGSVRYWSTIAGDCCICWGFRSRPVRFWRGTWSTPRIFRRSVSVIKSYRSR